MRKDSVLAGQLNVNCC